MPDIDDTGPKTPEAAREQEAEFFGVATGQPYDIGNGESWTLPYSRYMPMEMRTRYLAYLVAMEEDVEFETVAHPVTGKNTKRKKFPLRMKSAVTESNPKGIIDEDELLCRALMGDDVFERFTASGGVPGQVQSRWQFMNRQMEERLRRDPKSL